MPPRIQDEATALLVAQRAKLRGTPEQDAMTPDARLKADQAEEAASLRDRFAALRADHPLPPRTGGTADRAFFDTLSNKP